MKTFLTFTREGGEADIKLMTLQLFLIIIQFSFVIAAHHNADGSVDDNHSQYVCRDDDDDYVCDHDGYGEDNNDDYQDYWGYDDENDDELLTNYCPHF